jgi:hypothetical protein
MIILGNVLIIYFDNIIRVGSASTQQVSKRLQSELMNLMMSQARYILRYDLII